MNDIRLINPKAGLYEKILITGSEGFIGSHLVEHLIQKYKINALVLYNSFNSKGWLDDVDHKVKNKIKIFNGDIRDTRSIGSRLKVQYCYKSCCFNRYSIFIYCCSKLC